MTPTDFLRFASEHGIVTIGAYVISTLSILTVVWMKGAKQAGVMFDDFSAGYFRWQEFLDKRQEAKRKRLLKKVLPHIELIKGEKTKERKDDDPGAPAA